MENRLLLLAIAILGVFNFADAGFIRRPRATKSKDFNIKDFKHYCEDREDGDYNVGCISEFIACSNGVAIAMMCPANLVLDQASDKCLYRYEVDVCNQESTPPPSESTSAPSPSESTPPSSESTSAPPPSESTLTPPEEFSCENRTDGTYAVGCSSEFIACVSGDAIVLTCPAGFLKFDQQSHQCLPECDVDACSRPTTTPDEGSGVTEPEESGSGITESDESGSGITEPDESGSGITEPDESGSGITEPEESGSGITEPEESGSGELTTVVPEGEEGSDEASALGGETGEGSASGVEEESGSGEVVVIPFTVEGSGPEGSSFVASGEAIINVEESVGGKQVISAFVEAEVEGGSGEEGSALIPEDEGSGSGTEGSEGSGEVSVCDGVSDGTYSLGCNTEFVACVRGEAVFLTCPGNYLKFDESSHQCLPEPYVAECGANTSTTAEPVSTTESTSNGSELICVLPTKFSCADKEDGVYDQGCSSTFVVCIRESPIVMHCPNEYRYDSTTDKCLAPEFVQACDAETESSTEPPTEVPSSAEPLTTTSDEPSTEAPPPSVFTCDGKHDGVYPQEGFTEAVSCFNETVIVLICPRGLDLDTASKKCFLTTRGKRFAPSYHNYRHYSSPVDRNYMPGFCHGRPFGVHSSRCSPDYAVCLPHYERQFHCEHDHVYDSSCHQCKPVESVPDCPPPVKTTTPCPPPPPKTTPAKPEFSCARLPDGSYSLGCSSKFVVCTNHVANILHCPSHLRFDVVSSSCLGKMYVPACGGLATTTPLPPPTTTAPPCLTTAPCPKKKIPKPCSEGKSHPCYHPKMIYHQYPHYVGEVFH